MDIDLVLRCRCGALHGAVTCTHRDRHIVCYCTDCQDFARALGRSDDVLDVHGGTDILQLSPARLRIDAGREQLACLRLSRSGPLRWYAACCNTPIGNTLPDRWAAFIGLITTCLDPVETPAALDRLLGSHRTGVFAKDALGDRSELEAANGMAPGLMLHALAAILTRRVRGEHRRSPFFDAEGAPVAVPHLWSPEERAALRAG